MEVEYLHHQLDYTSRINYCIKGRAPRFPNSLEKLRSSHVQVTKWAKTTILLPLVVSSDIQVSCAPISELKSTCLRDLHVGEQCRGTFISLRTCEKPIGFPGISTIVEDCNGNGAIFTLYNVTADLHPNLDELLPIDTTFVLKDPFCTENESGDCILHCENPTDMIVVYEGHYLSHTINSSWLDNFVSNLRRYFKPMKDGDWSVKGHTFMGEQKFHKAIGCFRLALATMLLTPEPNLFMKNCYSQLAEAYFMLECFESSVMYARYLIELYPGYGFGLATAGNCCYKLRQYALAHRYYSEFMEYNPESKEYKRLTDTMNERREEISSGVFNINEMYFNHCKIRTQSLDCADYKGPIKITAIDGKGRGIVATRNINPGTLLCVSKALVFSWLSSKYVSEKLVRQHGNVEELVINLSKLIANNTETFGRDVYSLCEDNIPIEEGPVNLFSDIDLKREPFVNMRKLLNIVKSNFFGNCQESNGINGIKITPAGMENMSGCGVFILPSYFNHSCLPNASAVGYNDVLVIRSIRTIKVNEEIFIPYISCEYPSSKRETYCMARGFRCSCQLCQIDRTATIGIRALRTELFDKFNTLHKVITNNPMVDLTNLNDDLTKLLEQFSDTYNGDVQYPRRVIMSNMYAMHAKIYALGFCSDPDKRKKEIEDHFQTLQCLGFNILEMHQNVVVDKLVSFKGYLNEIAVAAVARLVYLYDATGDVGSKDLWYNILIGLENIYSGGDEKLVKIKHINPVLQVKSP